MGEIEEAREFIHKTLRESYASQNPEDLSNAIIALAGWRFRLGELVAQKNLAYEVLYSERKHTENEAFLRAKEVGKSNDEAKVMGEICAEKVKEQELNAMYEFNRVRNLWEDLGVALNNIKYKINALIKERSEGEYEGPRK